MNRILSQEEIDALVQAASGKARQDERRSASADSILTYNFRRPDRVSKEQLRSLHFLHDRFAKNISTSLSAFLRAMTDVMPPAWPAWIRSAVGGACGSPRPRGAPSRPLRYRNARSHRTRPDGARYSFRSFRGCPC